MSCSRPVRFAAAVTLALSLVASSALTASSNPIKPPRTRSAAEGAPAQSTQSAPPSATRAAADAARRAAGSATAPAEGLAAPLRMPRSYPFQPSLRTYPRGLPDQSDTAGLLGHDDLAPLLNAWMSRSNRISAQVVGQSTQGRDLYLVTLTAPESRAETARQRAWREQLRLRPAAAAANAALRAGYKTPIWFSANIHGNEWEGTDAAMQYIRRIVDAPADPGPGPAGQSPAVLLPHPQSRRPDPGPAGDGAGSQREPRHDHQRHPGVAVVRADRAGGPGAVRRGPARIHRRAAGGALRAAARGELRVRPVHPPRLRRRSPGRGRRGGRQHPRQHVLQHRDRRGGLGEHRTRHRAHPHPLPRHPLRLGRLPADLHGPVRRFPRRGDQHRGAATGPPDVQQPDPGQRPGQHRGRCSRRSRRWSTTSPATATTCWPTRSSSSAGRSPGSRRSSSPRPPSVPCRDRPSGSSTGTSPTTRTR